jgi:hypothetical protein
MAWFQNLNVRSKVILIFALAPAVTASLDNFTFDRVAVVKNIAGQTKLPASSATTQAARTLSKPSEEMRDLIQTFLAQVNAA